MTMGAVSSSSGIVQLRTINPNEMNKVIMTTPDSSEPLKLDSAGKVIPPSSSLLAPPSDAQKAAAKAEDRQHEAFARLKVEMSAKR
ncbi:hypothetical protein [Pseudomonas sp. SLFW]|uniref:hypothetical protein n=1 Tax=Pseudomonas sp. SLFW TaxID=2683259 RepID=UPI0014133C37|nr:hypothetical protein [Pseudomonas sp. SLFW]NBB10227.1 hypothetical protein [Pseudomonas sp. SLFW]